MPVRIASKERLQSSVTPSGLNVETTIVDYSNQSNDYIVEGVISLANLQAGDTAVIKTYVAVTGTTQTLTDTITFSGTQTVPNVRLPAITVPYNGKLKVTVTQTQGTIRSYPYTFIKQLMEET